MEEHAGVDWKKLVMSLGQHGGIGGIEWDDGVFKFIKQVKIGYDRASIVSIQTEYCDDNGFLHLCEINGGNDKWKEKVIDLDYPNEYLISIHGCMGEDGRGHYVVRSLTLESNIRSYGPFGVEEGQRFWFPTAGSKVVGFHGRAGWFLDSIGIKVVPIQNNTNTQS